jgi:outer membrane lipoprotein SlyB
MKNRLATIALIFGVAAVAGCQAPGSNLASNVYTANQVNTAQAAKVVQILAVMPAKVQVDNTQAQKTAEVIGGLLGAVGGGVLGNNLGHQTTGNTALGAAGGGVVGVAAGSLVPGKVLVDGVSITYEDGSHTLNSVQVGKLCQFVPGKAVVVSTSPMNTRIQPNNVCPKVATQS